MVVRRLAFGRRLAGHDSAHPIDRDGNNMGPSAGRGNRFARAAQGRKSPALGEICANYTRCSLSKVNVLR